MNHRLILVFIFLCLFSCDSTKYLTLDSHQYEIIVPPGTMVINEILYADQTEVTNIMYQEFMDWTSKIFGENSIELERIQLDKSVWDSTEFSNKLGEDYFEKVQFSEHPVVGVTLEQAKMYAKWRTDRVAELILIQKGLVKPEYNYSKDNYFTIEKYINGQYDWVIDKKNILVPEYKIPTKSEWELIAGIHSNHPNGIDIEKRENKKVLTKHGYLHNTYDNLSKRNLEPVTKQKNGCGDITCEVNTLSINVHGLYGIIGNVSELTSSLGVIKGGNWKSTIEESKIERDLPFSSPNAWTGFRNVARQKLLKVNNGS